MLVLGVSNERTNASTETFVTETKYNMDTGMPLASFTRLNGLLHAPPNGKPSYTLFDEYGRPEMMQWHVYDELHRENGGATVYIDPETGVHTSEAFYFRGRIRPRNLGPCQIIRDKFTGEVTDKRFAGDPVSENSVNFQSPT
ncbi:hypothetical protein NBRC116601_11760 [Cognatishimia sp. WU-CL00825]